MRKVTYIFLAIILVACQKQQDQVLSKPFSYDGISYESISAAVKAATDDDDCTEVVIKLMSDAGGDGVTLRNNQGLNVVLDLGTYTYSLNPGGYLNAGDNTLEIRGDGAQITTSDTTPAIMGEGGEIIFSGNVSLRGSNIIRSSSDISIEENYTGELSGNVTLNQASLRLYSSGCNVSIPILTVQGEEEGFFVDTPSSEQSGTVWIGQVVSDSKYPVCSVNPGVVSGIDGIHIHDFTEESSAANCVAPAVTELVCHECGYAKMEGTINEVYGTCDASCLVHHPATEPGSFSFGNVEYWECPNCGKCYADSHADNELGTDIYLFPIEYSKMLEMKHLGDEFYQESNEPFTIFSLIILVVNSASGFAQMCLLDDPNWDKLLKGLDEIIARVDVIAKKLNILAREINSANDRITILDRYDNLVELMTVTKVAVESIDAVRNNTKSKADSLKRIEEVKKIITDWAGYKIGVNRNTSPNVLTMNLIRGFRESLSGRPFTDIYEDYVQTICIWEHDGYPLRRAALYLDVAVTGFSYALNRLYCTEIKQYESIDVKKSDLNNQHKDFKDYLSSAMAADMDMTNREKACRVLNLNGQKLVYDRSFKGPHNFYNWLCTHRNARFHPKNEDKDAEKSCDQMIKDTGVEVDKLMSQEAARFLIQVYDRSRSSGYFARTLVDSCGFHEFPAGPSRYGDQLTIVIPKRTDGFRQLTDDTRNPSYKIFRWRSYYCEQNNDTFGVFGIGCENVGYMYKNNVTHNCKILNRCNIDRSSGIIDNMGLPGAFVKIVTPTFAYATIDHWNFVSIVSVDPPKRPEPPAIPELKDPEL